MKLCDINPYVRYVNMGRHKVQNLEISSYDARLFYIIDGQFTITVNGTEYNIMPKTLMLWRPGTRYKFVNAEAIKMIVLNFDYTQINNLAQDNYVPVPTDSFDDNSIAETEPFCDYEELNEPIILENMDKIEDGLVKLVKKHEIKTRFTDELVSLKLKEIIISVVSSLPAYTATNGKKIDKALEYINRNYNQDITNDDIGKLTGYHSYYLNRLIQKETGTTLKQYILNLRIDSAKELLTQSDTPISNIAEQCGFKNITAFSNSFKKRTGVSPSFYRNNFSNIL